MQGGILALDLAKVTGWAYAAPGARPAPPPLQCVEGGFRPDRHYSGSQTLGHKGCQTAVVFAKHDLFLSDMITVHAPAVIVFEAPFVGGQTHQKTAYQLMGLAAVTELICEKRDVRIFQVNNATVRKHFIGKGRGTRDELKRMTVDRCREIGWRPKDDNEADALAVLDFALSCPKATKYVRAPVAESVRF